MSVLFVVLPLAVAISAFAVVAFLWSARSGQLDDLETPPLRILRDDTAVRRVQSHRAESAGFVPSTARSAASDASATAKPPTTAS